MNCIFIYNPNSGKGKINKKCNYIKEVLGRKYDVVDVYETKSGIDTRLKAAEVCGKYDVLVFAGGDGTFNDIISGISPQPVRPILGYIPSGTVNDIARNLKIPKSIKKALQIIINGKTVLHDVGKVNHDYFTYVLALGVFSSISYRTKQHLKKKFGKIAYVLDAAKDVFKPTTNKISITINDTTKEYESPLILILNSRSVGGVSFNRYGHLNDGYFEIMVIKKGIYRGFFKIIRFFISGLLGLRYKHVVYYSKASHFSIAPATDTQWCIDGEAGPVGKINVSNLHHHFEIFTPNPN